jgi:hypothetical protein
MMMDEKENEGDSVPWLLAMYLIFNAMANGKYIKFKHFISSFMAWQTKILRDGILHSGAFLHAAFYKRYYVKTVI